MLLRKIHKTRTPKKPVVRSIPTKEPVTLNYGTMNLDFSLDRVVSVDYDRWMKEYESPITYPIFKNLSVFVIPMFVILIVSLVVAISSF